MTKNELIYEGKGKKLFTTEDPQKLVAFFKDDLTAFNAEKKGNESGKGKLNCLISEKLFKLLEDNGIKTHMIKRISDDEMEVKRVEIIPIEVVVRNIATGSLSKRLAIPEATPLPFTLVEFYYKDDALGDPLINDEHAMILGITQDQKELDLLKEMGRKVNAILRPYFDNVGLNLVDFKLEFGKDCNGEIILADEISPDSCRFWDKETNQKLDKDVFRQNLGNVKLAYEEVLNRLMNV
jgi:phosphoribosylaminoimidazole-succinocarboxamide synthase